MRPRKRTREELESALQYADSESSNMHCVLNSVINGSIDYTTHWFRERNGEGKYRFMLLRATEPSGGYIVTTFRFPGQMDYSTVKLFDEFFHKDWMTQWVGMVDNLILLRETYFKLQAERGSEL